MYNVPVPTFPNHWRKSQLFRAASGKSGLFLTVRADEDLGRRISTALAQSAVKEFLSYPEFEPCGDEAEPLNDLLEDIAGAIDDADEGADTL